MYTLQKKDIPAAGTLFADAFRNDPVWLKLFADTPDFDAKFNLFFQMPTRHALKYGTVWAPSNALEGLAAWVPDTHAEMGFWSMIRTGALPAALKLGSVLGKKMRPMFDLLPVIRRKHMAGKHYNYLMVLGVRTALQGKGYGRQLLDALIAECDSTGKYLYLETETDDNVKMYEHFGFTVLEQMDLPGPGLPLWAMARAPGQKTGV